MGRSSLRDVVCVGNPAANILKLPGTHVFLGLNGGNFSRQRGQRDKIADTHCQLSPCIKAPFGTLCRKAGWCRRPRSAVKPSSAMISAFLAKNRRF